MNNWRYHNTPSMQLAAQRFQRIILNYEPSRAFKRFESLCTHFVRTGAVLKIKLWMIKFLTSRNSSKTDCLLFQHCNKCWSLRNCHQPPNNMYLPVEYRPRWSPCRLNYPTTTANRNRQADWLLGEIHQRYGTSLRHNIYRLTWSGLGCIFSEDKPERRPI